MMRAVPCLCFKKWKVEGLERECKIRRKAGCGFKGQPYSWLEADIKVVQLGCDWVAAVVMRLVHSG